MHLLRAEKGFIIVGQDTDGTMTPIDLQMDWVVSKKKYDFIGKRSLYRSDTMREDRKQLVGLITDNPKEVLEEGAQIVSELNQSPVEMLGHVTSSYYSPNLNKSIALAVVKGGKNMLGKKMLSKYKMELDNMALTEHTPFDTPHHKINKNELDHLAMGLSCGRVIAKACLRHAEYIIKRGVRAMQRPLFPAPGSPCIISRLGSAGAAFTVSLRSSLASKAQR